MKEELDSNCIPHHLTIPGAEGPGFVFAGRLAPLVCVGAAAEHSGEPACSHREAEGSVFHSRGLDRAAGT